MEDTAHFNEMLTERGIKPKWADAAIKQPDKIETHADGTIHYIKQISEYGNRWLRVIVNTDAKPPETVTAFFDRRLKRKQR